MTMPRLKAVAAQRTRGAAVAAVGLELGLVVLGALLFAASHPSLLSVDGWGGLGFIALCPVFLLTRRIGYLRALLYGALYGALSYVVYGYWLANFHPLAIIIMPLICTLYLVAVFPLLVLAARLAGRWGFLLQAVLWVAYEFVKIQGFTGLSYGVIGYTQYLNLPLLGLASLTGVWGVSLLLAVPAAWLAQGLHGLRRPLRDTAVRYLREHGLPLAAWAVALAAAMAYGHFSMVDYSDARQWRVSLIQHNVDPWHGGVRAYRRSLEILTRLSDEALREDPDIVVWSETAFVPSIDWHTRFREDPDSYELVSRLIAYLRERDVPFLIGNGDGQLGRDRYGRVARLDYNAAVLYEGGRISGIYRKMHLVPFTEYFPFERQFPGIYEWLRAADTHLWEKGEEFTIFESGGVRFAAPICFEDTFGYISREFVRHGAEVIVNLTNDSWSHSVVAMVQHMAMAVFRAVENRRTMVRSTNGGITCVIDPNGRITHRIDPFIEATLTASVPVYTETSTLYTAWGEWFGALMLIASSAWILIAALVRLTISHKHRKIERQNRPYENQGKNTDSR